MYVFNGAEGVEPGSVFRGKKVRGWGRTNTGVSGERRQAGGYEVDIMVKFVDGTSEAARLFVKDAPARSGVGR